MSTHLVSHDIIVSKEKYPIVIFEKIEGLLYISLLFTLLQKKKVYIIEPFNAYHHSAGYRLYPKSISRLVTTLIRKKLLTLLPATIFYPDISTALFARINGLVEKTF